MEKIRDWDKKTSFGTTIMGAKLLPCFYYCRRRNRVERCSCREKVQQPTGWAANTWGTLLKG